MDKDGSSNINNPKDEVADVEINDTEDRLHEGHEKQLKGVNFPDDDTKADKYGAADETRLDDINESDSDGELLGRVHLDKSKHNQGKLADNNSDDHCEAQRGEAVSLEECHQEPKSTKQHHHDVNTKRICVIEINVVRLLQQQFFKLNI